MLIKLSNPQEFELRDLVLETEIRKQTPRLEMTKAELEAACPSVARATVLTVVVTDEKGRESRLHFSVGLTDNGRVVGEVLAVNTNKDTTKKVVSTWYKPRTRADEVADGAADPEYAEEVAAGQHNGFDS